KASQAPKGFPLRNLTSALLYGEFQSKHCSPAALWKEYQAQGKPKNPRPWLREELKKHFVYVTKPPAWIERSTIPKWPFFAGKPMVFIEQISVPAPCFTYLVPGNPWMKCRVDG